MSEYKVEILVVYMSRKYWATESFDTLAEVFRHVLSIYPSQVEGRIINRYSGGEVYFRGHDEIRRHESALSPYEFMMVPKAKRVNLDHKIQW